MGAIAAHCNVLADELARRLLCLRHANGVKVATLYGARAAAADGATRSAGRRRGGSAAELPASSNAASSNAAASSIVSGPTVAFNLRRGTGELIGYSEVIKLAALHDPPIQLRGGCCCNPGGCQAALGLSDEQVRATTLTPKP